MLFMFISKKVNQIADSALRSGSFSIVMYSLGASLKNALFDPNSKTIIL